MSLWSKLPNDAIKLIYEFDLTYKEKFDETLKFIKHACPTCCCDGGKKTRYRHHYDIGTFPFPYWGWEWRRRNACPKHNPEDFDRYTQLITIVQTYKKNGFSSELIASIFCARNPIPKKLFPYETGKIWIMDAVKYGFIDEFLDVEKRLIALQRKTHDNIIQQKLRQYSEE